LEIPGVGEKTARRLLETFGSLENIRSASEEELRKVLGPRQAVVLRQHLAE
ncbi:MAG: hypothetical protein HY648_00325, partial [Acidobacteria bacterium]|nr:hypothetical protein [Acidobacteriota bacterium]